MAVNVLILSSHLILFILFYLFKKKYVYTCEISLTNSVHCKLFYYSLKVMPDDGSLKRNMRHLLQILKCCV